MQSPKYTFYLSQINNTLSFDKDKILNEVNKIKWNEIHITQFIMHPKFKNDIIRSSDNYYSSICISIDNFDENINTKKNLNNYTFQMLDISAPYIYTGLYSSKITTKYNFTEIDNKIELKINFMIDGELINDYFYLNNDNDASTATIFEIELFFK